MHYTIYLALLRTPKKKKKIILGLAKNWILDLGFVDLVYIFVNYCIQLSEIMVDFETHLLVTLIGVLRVVKLYTYLLESFWNLDFITRFGTRDVCLILQ